MEQAKHALIDPLIEPDPSDETGLNTRFRSTFAPAEPITPPGSDGITKDLASLNIREQRTGSSVETNPYRRSRASSDTKNPFGTPRERSSPKNDRRHNYPSPPQSASPRRENFLRPHDYRSEILGHLNEGRPRRSSSPGKPTFQTNAHARRGSLRERYPGDTSNRPLDQIRKEVKVAHRAPHLRKKNFQGADVIDRLDRAGFSQYHHEGPYDAASLARNRNEKYSPVAAVRESNEEALRATPEENIKDALTRHRPLEGVANIPPGMPDRFGRVLHYQEGADLQREPGGDYRRWPGQHYHPDDLKGKGEPSFTIEKALKDHKRLGATGTELSTRHSRSKSTGHPDAALLSPAGPYTADASGIGQSGFNGLSMGSSLKKRFGSMRRRKQEVET
ncbi:hypothetical protein IAQ61_004423 [Plenodomus lingam]|uniref:Pal1 cell morphology protein n=1 Tax=Leptosphaeria maculans (strain JN3 / isolate v23.1.3 / race Av1-4-5-6-7-8) TaxID=985895 RepID=E4ZVG9_LEPMJ|nr:hypothetical protein LEMA_P027470.1 [Plenodomus lingam JN3]KAH9873796.1 hypothetical protein IAQ61_004423 [Plenodomus lingam]CBX95595.1 hypothetical protein LEMA_P027470.1 [Plenodomus lingam JN3]